MSFLTVTRTLYDFLFLVACRFKTPVKKKPLAAVTGVGDL